MAQVLERTQWASKASLLSHLEKDASHVLVGGGAEAPRRYYSFHVECGGNLFEVGVISSGLGIAPVLIAMTERTILIGHDECLTWVDGLGGCVVLSRRLNGVFYEFIPTPKSDEVIVWHELGVIRVDAEGRVLWSVDTDVVEECRWDPAGRLVLTVSDRADRVVISAENGTVLSPSE